MTLPSKKQQELLMFINGFIGEHGYAPSYRETMRALEYKSVSTVAKHVDGLVARGLIVKRDNAARSVTPAHGQGVETALSPALAHDDWLAGIIRHKLAEASTEDMRHTIDDVLEFLELTAVRSALKKD